MAPARVGELRQRRSADLSGSTGIERTAGARSGGLLRALFGAVSLAVAVTAAASATSGVKAKPTAFTPVIVGLCPAPSGRSKR